MQLHWSPVGATESNKSDNQRRGFLNATMYQFLMEKKRKKNLWDITKQKQLKTGLSLLKEKKKKNQKPNIWLEDCARIALK